MVSWTVVALSPIAQTSLGLAGQGSPIRPAKDHSGLLGSRGVCFGFLEAYPWLFGYRTKGPSATTMSTVDFPCEPWPKSPVTGLLRGCTGS